MNQALKDYKNLHEISRHARVLQGISHLLEWDQETFMPSGAAAIRGDQLKTLAGLIHTHKTSKKFADSLAKLINLKTGTVIAEKLPAPQAAALREWRRDYLKAKSLPTSFVEECTKLSSQATLAWREAKKNDDFKAFAPLLEKLIAAARKKADYLGYKEHPYDALLNEFEPDATTKEISKLFTPLRQSVVDLLKKIKQAKPVDDSFLFGKFNHDKQIEFNQHILRDMGYDMNHGRLDFSTHPFSLAPHPTDSRITTRIHPTALMDCISAVMHEAGHGLYEMGLPVEEYGTPLGDYASLGIHESQSRWWETRIGQSKAFWKHYLPILKTHFKSQIGAVSLEDFYRAINKVNPALIRIEADEVTYSLHVILRFEMERALIEGSLKVKDIPAVWNAKMKELLGVTPPNNAQGCLQDIHWAMGAFGYFPSYTLGNLYAAQFFEAFAKAYPDWEKRVAEGKLVFIKEWLHENVHQHGRRYTSQELIKKVTGKKFSADPFTNYLNTKYKEVYRL